jgi:hypothetical protein
MYRAESPNQTIETVEKIYLKSKAPIVQSLANKRTNDKKHRSPGNSNASVPSTQHWHLSINLKETLATLSLWQ